METNKNSQSLTYIPLGGMGDVTKNMHVYIYGNEILIVDCGIGFADNTMPGVDFLIPDVSYLKNVTKSGEKKIVGMVLTHGHEDHIGGLPFVLPSLPNFPIYGTQLTAAFANEKLKDFGVNNRVNVTDYNKDIKLGSFTVSLTHVTHSILDTSHPVITTPAGIFYHGSDFKFDFTPAYGSPSDLHRIASFGGKVLNLASDCLGSERVGYTPSEKMISESFEEVIENTKGKVFITTYSSNISRLNQAIVAAQKYGRKVCFIGRSFLKARDIGRELGYMNFPNNIEIQPQDIKRLAPEKVVILCAGSQGQPESGLMRIATDNDRDLKITKQDAVIFSSDPIPGNELNVYALIDAISKKGARVMHSDISHEFHVSGHGGQKDLELLISLIKPQYLLPIGGTYRHMVAYREIGRNMGYSDDKILLPESGQEIIFENGKARYGKKLKLSSIYVDQLTGEQVDNYIVLDRQKVAEEGIIVVIAEVDSEKGTLIGTPEIIAKGFNYPQKDDLAKRLVQSIQTDLKQRNEQNADWTYYRKVIRQRAEGLLFKERREPLVIPVVLEV